MPVANNDQYHSSGPTPEQWATFVREWWGYCQNTPIRVKHLYNRVANACPGFEFDHIDTRHGKLSWFGALMARMRNYEVAGFRVLPGPYRTTSYILTPGDSARVYSDGRQFMKQLTEGGLELLYATAQALVAEGRLTRVEPPEDAGALTYATTPIYVLDGKPLPIFAPKLVPVEPALWMSTPELRAHFDRLEAFERGEITIDGLRKCACGCGEFISKGNEHRYRWRQGHKTRHKADLLVLNDIGDQEARAELIRWGFCTELELLHRYADRRFGGKKYFDTSRERQRVFRAKSRRRWQQKSVGVMYDELVKALKETP